jgi:hypothetical protein
MVKIGACQTLKIVNIESQLAEVDNMKTYVLALFSIVCMTLFISCEAGEPPAIQQLRSAIQIERFYPDGRSIGGGSGVCIYSAAQVSVNDGPTIFLYLFSTAGHVLATGHPSEYGIRVFEYGERGERLSSQIFRNYKDVYMDAIWNRSTDAGMLIVKSKIELPVFPIDLEYENRLDLLYVGQDVTMVGSPLLISPILCRGIITQLNINEIKDGTTLPWQVDLLSIDGARGDSGGGIFNKKGKMIGILSLGFSMESHGFVLGMVNLREFYNMLRNNPGYSLYFEHLMCEVEDVPEPEDDPAVVPPASVDPDEGSVEAEEDSIIQPFPTLPVVIGEDYEA